jgi:hypothetical protein
MPDGHPPNQNRPPAIRSGVSAERRHLKKTEEFAAVCRRAATEKENRPPSS